MMLVDSFLFFQELELLEIRLEYLNPVIDKFLIIEAGQTFKGSKKEYNFEKNIKRYRKYIDKIEYYKIEDIYNSPSELLSFLKKSNYKPNKKIWSFIKNHSFYDKDNLSHILDTYHRECIHKILEKECNDDDIIFVSDLDEFPSFELVKRIKRNNKLDNIFVLVQHEFKYFLNNFSGSNWYGSIASPYRLIKNYSLNDLRLNSKNLSNITNGGYHFTSIGNKQTIIKKIESWAHQEFNNNIVKNNIEENLINGKDIFYRFKENKNKCINIENSKIIDERLKNILLRYDGLILKKLKSNLFFNFKYLYLQIKFNFMRIKNNPKKFLKKLIKITIRV